MRISIFLLFLLSTFASFIQTVSAEEAKTEVSVLMYHSILKDESKTGPYVITPYMFEEDLKYLSENAYTSVTTEDLLNFTERNIPLPDKAVMLTFEDGNYNNVYYPRPLLRKYGMKAVMFVIGSYCETASEEKRQNPNFSYVSWETLSDISRSDDSVWDVQSHTWDMHELDRARQGVKQIHGESDGDYMSALNADFSKITDKIETVTCKRPTAFAYPFGFMTDEAEEILKNLGYKITLSCESGTAYVGGGDDLYRMKRFTRFDTTSAQSLLEFS